MEPRIQYAQTKDGVSIAFYTLGEGIPPLVLMPGGPASQAQLEWQILEYRSYVKSLAQRRMVIRYDGRGSGLSEGDMASVTLDTTLQDIQSVVDRLELDRLALLGGSFMGPSAITYAARNTKRASHLILWNTAARGFDFVGSPRDRVLGKLMEVDWELYTETVTHLAYGWSAGEPARRAAARLRQSLTPEKLKAGYRAIAQMDASALLPQVKCPTLVLRRRELSFSGIDAARAMASKIPDARLTLLEGGSLAQWEGDADSVVTAIDEFLGQSEQLAARAPPAMEDIHTILFTDVEGSTALTQRLGDAKARDLLREHERIVREALKAHGGSEVKTMGDGFMTSFPSATRALECSIAMQRAFAQHNEAANEPILVRVGLNAGEPIAEGEDLFGTAVIAAARIAAQAEGGQIFVANVIRELAAGKDFLFTDRGHVTLRGFDEPVRLYEVRWQKAR